MLTSADRRQVWQVGPWRSTGDSQAGCWRCRCWPLWRRGMSSESRSRSTRTRCALRPRAALAADRLRAALCSARSAHAPARSGRAQLGTASRSCAPISLAHAPQVGPFANPSELYEYYSLPFCRPTALEEKWLDLGEVLKGDRAHKTPYARRAGAYDGRRALCRAVGAAAGRAGDAAWRDGARACPGLPPHAPRPLTSPPVHPWTHRLARNPPRNPPHNP